MAKNPVKKTAVKKIRKPAAKKTTRSKTSTPKKGSVKKPVTEKERQLRSANLIANTEKKKKPAGKRLKKTTSKETSTLLDAVVEGMKEKKAKNIMILNLQGIENRVTDYFVICDADSRTHVNSIADSVEEIVHKNAHESAYHTEGQQNGEWILIDYINVVAHVFLRETRDHYNIEALWGDADITLIND
jgi:ribosome-associated protein